MSIDFNLQKGVPSLNLTVKLSTKFSISTIISLLSYTYEISRRLITRLRSESISESKAEKERGQTTVNKYLSPEINCEGTSKK
jgi:hypothetical protein